MRTDFLTEVLDEQVGNMTGRHFKTDGPYRAVRAFLEGFARQAVHLAINSTVKKPDIRWSWKQEFADASEQAQERNGLENLIDETLRKLDIKFPKVVYKSSMNRYGLRKVATYAGQVARMIKIGLDPKYLKMTEREVARHQAELLRVFAQSGMPTTVIEVPVDVTLN